MVAISLYRGNLHRVPDVPRRWLMPTPKISLKDFRILLNRRSRSLARLHSATATTSNPNPNPNLTVKNELKDARDKSGFLSSDSLPPPPPPPPPPPQVDPPKIPATHPEELPLKEGTAYGEDANDRNASDGGDGSVKPVDGSDAFRDAKPEAPQSATNLVDENRYSNDEKPKEILENPKVETSNTADALTDKEKRKKEVEEKLEILNAKKHSLVQALKQILNAEEELKRRNNMQGIGTRPSVPLQADATNDSGSLTRLATPRLGSEGNLGGDMEGGEADDASNHNMHSRHLLRTSSTSPCSDSPHRRPAFSAVPHPPRASLAVAGSPLRFAPTGHQGHPPNLPTISVSGTSYMTSSPSPAASGGTSSFRDGRLPSPWN